MINDESQARDEIFGMLKVAWVNAPQVNGQAPKVLWQGQATDGPPDCALAYARATVLHGTRSQSALAGANGVRRYTASGIVIVQCFGPLASDGLALAESLAKVAREAFEGQVSPGGIWFRNCRVNEVGPDASWFQLNMVADFEYDTER